MEKEKLLNYIAPCSLLCYACPSFKDGPVSESAKRLHCYWEGFCECRGEHLPEEQRAAWYSEFNTFDNTLQFLSGASCPGCRNNPPSEKEGWGCIEDCVIQACVKEREADFCAECDEFPCRKAKDFLDARDKKFSRRWENGNRRMKEIGIAAYFEENKDISHYIHYKKKTETVK